MNKKPQIDYCKRTFRFLCDGEPITQEQARVYWDDTKSADWSLTAYQVMAQAVLA